MTASQLARIRIHLGQAGGLLFLWLAQPRLRGVFFAGFLLSLAGEALRIWAAGTIKKNKELASDGPYALVRHPLYLGSFLIAAGFTLSSFNPWHPFRTALVFLLSLGGFALVYNRKMRDEEDKIAGLFGPEYDTYRASTPMFWPDFKRADDIKKVEFDAALAVKHREHHTIAGVIGIAALLWMKLIYQL